MGRFGACGADGSDGEEVRALAEVLQEPGHLRRLDLWRFRSLLLLDRPFQDLLFETDLNLK